MADSRSLNLMRLGLSFSVFLDATVVRLLLVPATMELLGDRNWLIPKWLDQLLPQIHVERVQMDDGTKQDSLVDAIADGVTDEKD